MKMKVRGIAISLIDTAEIGLGLFSPCFEEDASSAGRDKCYLIGGFKVTLARLGDR